MHASMDVARALGNYSRIKRPSKPWTVKPFALSNYWIS